MGLRDEIDYLIQEEEKRQARLKKRMNPTRRAALERRHPTYIAVLAAKLLMKSRGLKKRFFSEVPSNGDGQKITVKDVTVLDIVKEDISTLRQRVFNGNPEKMPKMKVKDTWEDWRDYFEPDQPINVPPRYDAPVPEPQPEKVVPEFPETKPEISPEVEAFFEDSNVEVES